MPKYNASQHSTSSPRTGSLGLLLVLLLLALLAFLFWYTGPDGRTYGDAALEEAQTIKNKTMRKARGIYHCAIQGCTSKESELASTQVPAPADNMASAGEKTLPASVAPAQQSAPAPAEALSANAAPTFPAFRTNPILPPGITYNNAPTSPSPPAGTNSVAQPPERAAPQSAQGTPQPAIPPMTSAAQVPPHIRPQPAPYEGSQRMQQRLLVPPPGTHAFDNLGEQPGLALLAARQAIAQHRYAEAMSIYRRQIAGNQDDIDAYGELGNLLWFTEHRQEAAQNYYEAATRLLDRGLREVARPLLPAIEQYEPVLASLLRQKAAQFDR